MGNVRSSGDITVTGSVTAKPGKYHGLTGYCAAADVEITLYDNATAAAGRVIDRMKVDFSVKPTDRNDAPADGVDFQNGIWLVISGVGAIAIVHFESH